MANSSPDQILFTQSQPFTNHNGGMIAFGPNDGYLYIGLGDGGSANDPKGAGQRLDTLLGKLLRLDVSGEPGRDGAHGAPGVFSGAQRVVAFRAAAPHQPLG